MYVKSLKHALTPIMWLNCICCMGIFEIPVNHPRYILSIIYTISVTIGYFTLLYKRIYVDNTTKFSLHMIIVYFVECVNVIVATCSIILFWRKSQNIYKIIKRSTLADDTLEALGIKKNYQKTFYKILTCLSFWIAGMILLNAMHVVWMMADYGHIEIFYSALCFGLPIIINSVVDLTFSSLIRCVKLKFQNTNILLNDVVLSANEGNALKIRSQQDTHIAIIRVNYKSNKDMIKHLVQTLKQLHLEITKLAQEVNRSFCVQILLEMAVHFTIVTAVCYSLYTAFSGQSTFKLEKIIAMIIWGFVYSMKIILMNNLCTSVSNEAYKTGEIVQTFEGPFLDDELKEEIRQFTQQIMLNTLHFTAAGFFKINNIFTGAFFATVTTYVVILIQINTST